MPTSSSDRTGPTHAVTVMQLQVHAFEGTENWDYKVLLDRPPADIHAGWGLLGELPAGTVSQLRALCVDSDQTFPALVDGTPCLVIEQEFQAGDAGDDWPESSSLVVERLRRALLPKLGSLQGDVGGLAGIVADPAVTFCGRPTLFVALPAETTTPDGVRAVLSMVRAFAYPSAH
jgi:hypothetical protein